MRFEEKSEGDSGVKKEEVKERENTAKVKKAKEARIHTFMQVTYHDA